MICVHCGLCCFDFPCTIISREYAESDITNLDNFPEEAFIIKPQNTPCPHLFWKDSESQCEVHSKPWYKTTPCFDFSQIESSPKDICRIGEWILKKNKDDKRFDYELKCKTFLEPKEPDKIHEEFERRIDGSN